MGIHSPPVSRCPHDRLIEHAFLHGHSPPWASPTFLVNTEQGADQPATARETADQLTRKVGHGGTWWGGGGMPTIMGNLKAGKYRVARSPRNSRLSSR